MNAWLSEHWDEVALGIVSAIITGVVGYYSGIVALKSEVASLREQLAVVETELSASVNPKLKVVASNRD
ncbi:MAG: hypothetical protein OET90_04485 [Desulfuromonadales bacterium]|nr:hypothetical protein [Desulfuromonadales bacterium]